MCIWILVFFFLWTDPSVSRNARGYRAFIASPYKLALSCSFYKLDETKFTVFTKNITHETFKAFNIFVKAHKCSMSCRHILNDQDNNNLSLLNSLICFKHKLLTFLGFHTLLISPKLFFFIMFEITLKFLNSESGKQVTFYASADMHSISLGYFR